MSQRIKLHAPDISCTHCAMTIQRELAPIQGVVAIEVDVSRKTIDLEYVDEAALERAKAVLRDIGYPAEAT